jgi:hypothetical protein
MSVTSITLANNQIGVEGLVANEIGDVGTSALADALKVNRSVATIILFTNNICDEGASALADALKVNTSVTCISLWNNRIGDKGAAALAGAIEVNMSVTTIDLDENLIGNKGAAALVNALQVNTSLTCIDLDCNAIDESNRASIDALIARNKRFRSLFLFDARQMLLSLMCADECGVVWPYLLESATDGIIAADAAETIRAEFKGGVMAERRRRLHAGLPGPN